MTDHTILGSEFSSKADFQEYAEALIERLSNGDDFFIQGGSNNDRY